MPTITVSDATFAHLAQLATERQVAVEHVAAEMLSRSANALLPSTEPVALTGEAWRQKFEEFNQAIQAEAARYPSGFRLDDSREAMYAGCGE